jgi:Spx/MgsR family transcriptional regulator
MNTHNGNLPNESPPCRIYGIKNCDSMKKAFNWLAERGISYEFHDYKKAGVPRDRLVEWCRTLGWKSLLNTKGPTWRKLDPEQQDISSQSKAVTIMMEHSSVIRRPIVEMPDGQLLIGFDPTIFESFLNK